jgi:transmembrane sensor
MSIDRFWELLSKKISGEASEVELKELESSLNDPGLKASAETLSALWQQSLPFENGEAMLAFEKHVERMKKADTSFSEQGLVSISDANIDKIAQKRPGFKKWLFPLTGVAAAFLIFIALKNNTRQAAGEGKKNLPVSQVMTKPGSKTQLHLPDGSSVWLNASSNLTYDENFGKKNREVNLTGEAFFDVVKDPSSPFIIHTKTVDIKVLGTQFNVKAYPEESFTETALIRGSVEVTVKKRPGEKHFLKPNEKMVVANDIAADNSVKKESEPKELISTQSLSYDVADSVIVETSWVSNRLIFHQNETFGEMVPKLERWYGVHFNFEYTGAKNYRPFVSFTNETITQALDALKEGIKFNYKINGDNITIIR